jgi:tetratricopeptide (TPR) repeat protein
LASGVALCEELGDRQRLASALSSQGCWTRIHADYAEGTALLDRALSLARDAADPGLIGWVLQATALSADLRREDERKRARLAAVESIRLDRQTGDALTAAITHWPLGLTALYDRDFPAARQAFATYRDGARAAGDTGGVAVALTLLGDAELVAGDLPAAAPFYQESLALWRDLGVFSARLAHVLCGLGDVALTERDLAAARTCFEESLATAHEAGALGGLARALEGLGRIAALQVRPERAARLCGAAETLRLRAGPGRARDLETHLAYLLPPARATLSTQIQESAWTEGRTMTLEEAVAYALEAQPAAGDGARRGRPPPDA